LLHRRGGWGRLNLFLPASIRTRTSGIAESFADEAEAVAVGILYVHFTVAPGLVNRRNVNSHAPAYKFRVKSIYILNEKIDHATRNAIPRKRGNMNPHAIPAQAHVAWIRFGVIRPVGEFQAETESAGIEIRGRSGIGNVEKRNGVP